MKLTPKLALVFISFAILLLLGVGMLAYESGRGALEAATFAELESTSVEKSAAIDNWVAERKSDIAALSHSPAILQEFEAFLDGGSTINSAREPLIRELSVRTGSDQPYLALFILSPESGEILIATDLSEEGKFKEDRSYFIEGKSTPFVSTVYYSLEVQGAAITASAPLRTAEGELLGVLAGRLNLEELNTIIQRRSGLRQTDDAFLVNTSNLFVTQPHLLPDPAVLQRGIHTEAVRQCLQNRSNGTLSTLDYRDIPAIITYRWLPEHEMCLIVKIDQAEALAPVRDFGRAIVWIALVTLILACGLAFALAHSMIRPILAMQMAAQGYGRGQLDVRLPDTRKDELGALAHEFNQMAAALAQKEMELRSYAQTLEQRVEERTRELQESEARYRGLIESQSDLIVRVDLENCFTFVNDAYCQKFGLKRAEILGQESFQPLVHPEDLPHTLEAMKALYEPPYRAIMEQRAFTVEGVRWIEWQDSAIRDENSRIVEIQAIGRDITERKQAEEALRESEERLKRAQEIAHLGSWELDLLKNQLTWSDEVYRIFGLQPQEFGATYEAFLDAVHPEDRAAVNAAYSGSIQEGRDAYEIEHRVVRRSSGEIRIVHEKCEHFRNQDNQIIRSIGMVHDITERKRAEENVRRSEAMLRAVLDQMPSGVTVRDARSGELLLSNARSREILNMLVDTPAHFAQYRGFHPDGSPYRNEEWPVSRSIATGEVVQGEEIVCERSDEAWITLSINSAPVRDRQGQIVMGVGVFDDITERKQAERQLRYHAALLSNINDAIVASDAQFRITVWNSGAESLYGWKAEEVIGRNGLEIIRTEWPGQNPEEMRRTIAETGRWRGEATQMRKDGTRFPVEVSSLVLRDDNGQITGYISVNRDITARKQTEEALQRMTEDLRRSNAELEQFAYVASHDLQEPLRMVSSYMQLLKRRYQGKLDKDADEFIAYAVDGATRMQNLINDLLAFSRVGTRGRLMGLSSCEKVLEEALINLQVAVEESQAIITHDPLPTVFCDQPQLVQLFQNLLANSIKFRGQQTPQIHISASQEHHEWLFSVRDNGIGLDPKFGTRIFEIFQRLHSRTAYPGTGIGLAICKRIVQRHDGHIWVESKPGAGATFYFTIPVKETL